MFHSPGCSVRASSAVAQLRASVGDLASSAGSMPRTMAPRISSPRPTSACAATKGAAPDHARVARAAAAVACQSASAPPCGVEHLDVRDHAEHAVAHLLLEAVHHAQHDDQRRHAQRDAQHRHAAR
jgi:hypothetical protein